VKDTPGQDLNNISQKHAHQETSLLQFVRSICPQIPELEMRLLECGIVDGLCIQALAGLPYSEKDIFLKESLRLNPFQVHVVRAALGRRLESALL